MTNPYQSPKNASQEVTALPIWYVWFYKTYWVAWWIGTALIAGSWFNIVTPTVGWIGFALAGAAVLGSYVLPSLAGIKAEDYVMLDSRLLQKKGDTYYQAIERFRNGASLAYDGVAFGFRPNNEITCAIVAASNNLDDAAATETAQHAKSVFEKLLLESDEFAEAVSGRTFRISIVSGFEPNARELCRVIDGKLDWQR
jgi:hypothetical protein